jgi:hypothetical protein
VIDFKPSDVDLLGSFPPLCATMGRTEREMAAAALVWASVFAGDVWQPIKERTFAEAINKAIAEGVEPLASMMCNPFCRPDYPDLIAKGYAIWSDTDGQAGLGFTAKGLEALRRWLKKGPPPAVA